MARLPRGEYLDPQTMQIVHAVQRCVRRVLLCGNDPLSGKSHEHRRQRIRDRLELLASVFAFDCLTYAVMSNHRPERRLLQVIDNSGSQPTEAN